MLKVYSSKFLQKKKSLINSVRISTLWQLCWGRLGKKIYILAKHLLAVASDVLPDNFPTAHKYVYFLLSEGNVDLGPVYSKASAGMARWRFGSGPGPDILLPQCQPDVRQGTRGTWTPHLLNFRFLIPAQLPPKRIFHSQIWDLIIVPFF